MKRIWFGAALLVTLLILGLGSSSFMERTHLAQAESLNRAADLAASGSWKAAEHAFSEAKTVWDENSPIISGLCDQEPMDQIEGFFAELEVFLRQQDAVSFSSSCRYLAEQLEALGRSYSFNLQNFF